MIEVRCSGIELKAARELKRWSLRGAGRRLGTSASNLRRLEAGQTPGLALAQRIHDQLGLAMPYFVGNRATTVPLVPA